MKIFKPQLGIAILLFFAFSTAGCGTDAQSKNRGEEEVLPAIPVETTLPQKGEIAALYTGTATLEALEETDIVARSGGIVVAINVEEGDNVRKGQKLAKLDDERLVLEMERAKVALDKLSRLLDRNQELYDQKLISTETYEGVKSDFETQQAVYNLSKLSVEQTTIVAPFNGVISARMIKMGNMVQAHVPTFRITAMNPLLAVMYVPERELSKMKVELPTVLKVDALSGKKINGVIKRVSPVVDPATGTFKVTIEVKNTDRTLKPGMFGRIGIVYDVHRETVLLPRAAVLQEDNENTVFFVKDSMAFQKNVSVGYDNDAFIEIIAGVGLEDQVITAGQTSLRDSTRVEIIDRQ